MQYHGFAPAQLQRKVGDDEPTTALERDIAELDQGLLVTGHRRVLRMLLLTVLAVALVSACGGAEVKSGCGERAPSSGQLSGLPQKLTVGVANNIAMAAPLTRLDSLAINETALRNASTPEELRVNFIAGRYDVAAMPINVAANLCARGVDVALLGTVSGNIVYLMAPPGTTLDDLRGKTLHVPFRNDIVDLMTRQILTGAGIGFGGTDGQAALTYHPTPLDIATGITAGEMTYAVLPEHLATVVADTSSGTVKAISLQDLWVEQTGADALPFAGFVVRSELADRYPDLVNALQANFVGSVADVRANPVDGAAAIAAVIPVPVDVTAAVLPSLAPVFTPASTGRSDTEQLYRALMRHEPEAVGGAMPPSPFYLGELP